MVPRRVRMDRIFHPPLFLDGVRVRQRMPVCPLTLLYAHSVRGVGSSVVSKSVVNDPVNLACVRDGGLHCDEGVTDFFCNLPCDNLV